MDDAAAGEAGFFVSGGTVPLESRSYVEREADKALFEALSSGRFCYVLNSRQMGKSSLCVRTMARLQKAGARTAFVDLTKIGGRNVTPDQWYAGLVVEVGRALGLRTEMLKNWQEEQSLSPMQRFFSALRDIALEKVDSQIVIFVDEIDATRSLSFSANEFFAGIRECYNRRVHDPAYARLTFCLLGVAVPGDLVADPTTTPFNIGERVFLADFTEQEAAPLATGFGAGAKDILQRILYWTHGHPFLTQSLASTAVSRGDVKTPADVDRLVDELLFQAKSRETNINLADVGNRILAGAPDPSQVAKYRADVLSLYEKILKGEPVYDDESNKLAAVLKLSGIVRVEERLLKVRNRIYERVFDKTWIRENMPGAELRRQRRAFIKGVVRTGLVAAAVLALIGWLAWKATRERDRANYEVYVATMNLMGPLWEKNNIARLRELLDATQNSPARGWEWDYWNRMVHLEVAEFPRTLPVPQNAVYQTNGKIYLADQGRILEYSPDSGAVVDVMPAMTTTTNAAFFLSADGKRLVEFSFPGQVQTIDLTSRTRLIKLEDIAANRRAVTPDGRWIVGARLSEFVPGPGCSRSAVLWNTETGQSTSLPIPCTRGAVVSPDGKMLAVDEQDTSRGGSNFQMVVREFGTWKILASFETAGTPNSMAFSPRGDRLATGSTDGWVQLWDLKARRETARIRSTDSIILNPEFSSDGAWLATGAVNRLGHLYDVSGSSMKLMATFRDAASLSISPDKSRVAAAYFSSYEALRIYDPKTYVETPTALSGLGLADGVSVSARKPYARARSGDKVYELDPLTGSTRQIDGLPGRLLGMPNNDEAWGLVQTNDDTLEIADVDLRRSIATLPKDLPGEMQTPLGVVQFPDNRRAALFSAHKNFDIWDVTAAHLVKHVETHDLVNAAKASPDGRWLAIALANGDLSLWDTTTWAERLLSHVSAADSLSFSADGARMLAGTANDNAEVWDTASGRLIGKLVGHSQGVIDAAFSPDGRRIVTASADTTVGIWDAATLRELTTLSAGNRIVNGARFTEDGKSIVSIDDQGTAKMWLTKSAQTAGIK